MNQRAKLKRTCCITKQSLFIDYKNNREKLY